MKTASGRTLTINCNTRQEIEKIKDEVEKTKKIPKAHQCLDSQGKTQKDRKTIVDSNIKKGTTIEMTLRLQGGM